MLIGHHVDLAHEVLVGLHPLTYPSVLHINKNVNYTENGNYVKKMRVNVTYPTEAPQRPHRVTVCGVNVILQLVILGEVGLRPTYVEASVDPKL
jgi:hypothetical protein